MAKSQLGFTIYVVGVNKHNPKDANYQVNFRLFDGEQVINDFSRPIAEEEKPAWDSRVGKMSAAVSLSF